jgi:excisionase family DNA binding protein
MAHLTIREASQLIGRTSATIRRYIRSGRLKAEKEIGKFGEEYRIPREDLLALGFTPSETPPPGDAALVRVPGGPPPAFASDAVPIALYNELLMKHEQILVQYGMIRAGGQKLLEFKADAEAEAEEIARGQDRYQALRQRAVREIAFLRKRLREMEIQIEERNIEITLLQEKVNRPEQPTDGRTDSIETSLQEVRRKERAVAELAAEGSRPLLSLASGDAWVTGFPPLDRKEDH